MREEESEGELAALKVSTELEDETRLAIYPRLHCKNIQAIFHGHTGLEIR
jgi:hypothetical protein